MKLATKKPSFSLLFFLHVDVQGFFFFFLFNLVVVSKYSFFSMALGQRRK